MPVPLGVASMKFTVKAKGTFLEQLKARAAKWAGATGMAVCIKLPPELQFIYWQEYGVPAHVIEPREDNPANVLVFPGEGGTQVREHVAWPGIKPTRTITKALDEIRFNVVNHLQPAMRDGGADNPEIIAAALMDAAEEAKAIIAGGLAADLPGTRPDNPQFPKQSGKLHGETAASAFTELAEVTVSDE